jgi:hypothetical protein
MSRHGGKVRLGKKKYTVLRNISSGGNYDEYGEVIEGVWESIEITANIQGALVYNKMRMTNAGDVSKDTISVRSNQDLYKARVDVNGQALLADRIFYKGTYWEVKEDIDYNNLRTAHIEVLATRLDEQPMEREI